MNFVSHRLLPLILPALLYAQNLPESLPKTLGSLRLVRTVAGDEAQSFLNRLHDKAVAPKSSLTGQYGSQTSSATLYISAYESISQAINALNRMTARIRSGNPVFRRYEEARRRGLTISRCTGLGQVHFFFRFRERVLWLAVDPPVASQTIDILVSAILNNPRH